MIIQAWFDTSDAFHKVFWTGRGWSADKSRAKRYQRQHSALKRKDQFSRSLYQADNNIHSVKILEV